MSNTTTKTPPTATEPAAPDPHGGSARADAAAWKDIVLWARRNGVTLTELRVGEVHAALIDTAVRGTAVRGTAPVPPQSDEEAKANLYSQYGGEVLRAHIAEATPTAEDEEDEEEERRG